MAISFDSLPTSRPSQTIAKGSYYATIESAEMKQPKDITKPLYLNMLLALKNKEGKSVGKVYDILAESDKELVKFKLARFITALGLNTILTGTFELADLCKIIKNKELIVDVIPEKQNGEETGRTVVDALSGGIYYPMSEASEIFKTDDANTVHIINAPDAADANNVHNTSVDEDDIF
jgi:hypothetical protein